MAGLSIPYQHVNESAGITVFNDINNKIDEQKTELPNTNNDSITSVQSHNLNNNSNEYKNNNNNKVKSNRHILPTIENVNDNLMASNEDDYIEYQPVDESYDEENDVSDKVQELNGNGKIVGVNGYQVLKMHPYSKPYDYIESTNVDNPHDDNETKESSDDQNIGENQLKLSTMDEKIPDHHARRPMNAFLIFCKRHRAIVREKHQSYENRKITTILGEWWALLTNDEKECYKDLANTYKTAFFKANPTFKWYKLPAPPKNSRSAVILKHQTSDLNDDYVQSDLTSPDYEQDELGVIDRKKGDKNVAFKFADEAQMGSLNSLMPDSPHRPNSKSDDHEQSKPGETILNIDSNAEPFSNMKSHAAKMESNGKSGHEIAKPLKKTLLGKHSLELEMKSNQTVGKDRIHNWLNSSKQTAQKITDERNVKKVKPNEVSRNENIFIDVEQKTSRSCKGARYKEFMSQAKKYKSSASESSPTKSDTPKKINVTLSHQRSNETVPSQKTEREKCLSSSSSGFEDMSMEVLKHFDASDFNLDEKIQSLPAQSMQVFIDRKTQSKNRKKIRVKRRHNPKIVKRPPANLNIIGSRRRKARKESITRRDINTSEQKKGKSSNEIHVVQTGLGLEVLATAAELLQTSSEITG